MPTTPATKVARKERKEARRDRGKGNRMRTRMNPSTFDPVWTTKGDV